MKPKADSIANIVPKALSLSESSPFELEWWTRTFTRLFDYHFNFPSSVEELLLSDEYPD